MTKSYGDTLPIEIFTTGYELTTIVKQFKHNIKYYQNNTKTLTTPHSLSASDNISSKIA